LAPQLRLHWLSPRIGPATLAALLPCVVCGSCGGHAASSPNDPYPQSLPIGRCSAITQQHPIEGHTHVTECSYVEYHSKPPSSGNHYPFWAAYKTYTAPIPEGFWVHNLEHGAVVVTYNCPKGCDADIAAAGQMLANLPTDTSTSCLSATRRVRRRSILVPDPNLDVPFAASAWGWTLRANCFDSAAFREFALAHYNQAPEDICQDGNDPTMLGLPADCGYPGTDF
jgi:hypothetical protein